ncbi:efflux RND transporter periplasmic adaptor subunit [Thalassomonas sp. RHCl1]|uniref:efflux RND transporter periplasmic adaptor subunit n=1 Tax=Thalassomonas sp. RHCl1 TaxID=2995320 RepID=UPI00248B579B|nr:efflux RND transporter periplasmic adaptor subunit [Thalassomonas sp. RHCl1]
MRTTMNYLMPCLVLSLLLSACKEEQVAEQEAIRPIAWVEVEKSGLEQVRRLSGIVQPVESAELSFQVAGKVAEVYVKLGDVVKQGQLLAKIENSPYRFDQMSSRANLEQSIATQKEAENEYRRYAELEKQGLVSASGYDNAKTAYATANSAIDLARAQLDISNKNLKDTRLLAPYDGKITQRMIEPSMQVAAGQGAFDIEGQMGLEVQVMVPETLVRDISLGQKLAITYPVLPDVSGSGVISEIGSKAQSANAFPVTVLVKNDLQYLRAGMTAEVNFTFTGTGRSGYRGEAFRLPLNALGAGIGQQAYVFVYDPQSSLVAKRRVVVENILNNEVFISSGLKQGEIIATAGVTYLRHGQRVNLLDQQVKQFN